MTLSIAVQLVSGQTDYLVKSGHADIWDFACSSRPHTAQAPDNVQRTNYLILADKRVTVKELSLQVGVGEANVCRILKQLQLKMICARWVLRMLKDVHKEIWKSVFRELLK